MLPCSRPTERGTCHDGAGQHACMLALSHIHIHTHRQLIPRLDSLPHRQALLGVVVVGSSSRGSDIAAGDVFHLSDKSRDLHILLVPPHRHVGDNRKRDLEGDAQPTWYACVDGASSGLSYRSGTWPRCDSLSACATHFSPPLMICGLNLLFGRGLYRSVPITLTNSAAHIPANVDCSCPPEVG